MILLLISWVNYYNLSKARLLILRQQIQTRLIIGSDKRSLIFQSIAESGFHSFLALLLAIVILDFVRTPVSSYLGIRLIQYDFSDFLSIWPVILTIVLITILSGSLPLYSLFFQGKDL